MKKTSAHEIQNSDLDAFSAARPNRFRVYLATAFLFCLSLSATAATFTVDTDADDETDGCGANACTLREAINAANADAQPDTVVFAPNVTGTITLAGAQLVVSSNLTISGPGARILTVSGGDLSRVFAVVTPIGGGDTTVSISGLRIARGLAQPVLLGSTVIGDGGGILNGALLGAISGTSTLNLTDVAVDDNRTTTLGGGVATRLNAVTNIYGSTVSNNVANAVVTPIADVGGGGISNVGGSITNVVNSTVSDNNTTAAGGGILNVAGIVNITNSTISFNDSTVAGGGVVSTAGVVPTILGVANVRNTIIAENNDLLGTNILGRDVVGVAGSFNSLGNNLIGSNFGVDGEFEASVWVGASPQPNLDVDLVGGVQAGNQVIDPLLGALANNGGQTDTRLPQASSPAIDHGNDCVTNNSCAGAPPLALTNDQRGAGFARRRGAAVEIGAVELQPLAPTAADATLAGRVTGSDGRGIARARVTLVDADGTTRVVLTNPSGGFSFIDVAANRSYFLQVQHKRYVFQARVVAPVTDLLDLNLIGTSLGREAAMF